LLSQLGDALPFGVENRLDDYLAGGDRASEGKLGMGADAIVQHVANLGHHESGHEQWAGCLGEQLDAATVIDVARGGSGI
jgi:hypothetical protein